MIVKLILILWVLNIKGLRISQRAFLLPMQRFPIPLKSLHADQAEDIISSLLDIGAGPGTALLAAIGAFLPLERAKHD